MSNNDYDNDTSGSFFGDDEQVDKIVFRPLDMKMDETVKKVSDPAPRPLPQALDDETKATDWIPGVKMSKKPKKPKKESNVDYSGVWNILKWLAFSVITIGIMAGIGYVVLWVFNQYGL